jgi:hypothetical protein
MDFRRAPVVGPGKLHLQAAFGRPTQLAIYEEEDMPPTTVRFTARLTVKEGTNNPFLAFEPTSEMPGALTGIDFSLDLAPGTTLEGAQRIAKLLNGQVVGLAATTWD